MSRHLLSAADLDRDAALEILDTAEQMDRALTGREIKKLPPLRGRTVVNLFYEDSTRTRTSFELAAKRLSADVVTFSAKGSSVSKGESLKDTALTLEAMGADAVVVRHSYSGAPHRLSEWVRGSVINAGDGTHEHPTQALLDAFTIRRRLRGGAGDLAGLRVAIVGDVLHSRVARSNVLLLTTLGASVTLVGPPTLLPVGVESWPVTTSFGFDDALPGSDVVMMLRVQRERMGDSPHGDAGGQYVPSAREYARRYGLDARRVGLLGDDAIVMHPGPMNRGMEIAAEVADDPKRSTIVEQVTNGGERPDGRLVTSCWAVPNEPACKRITSCVRRGRAHRRRRRAVGPVSTLLRDVRPYGEDAVDVLLDDGVLAQIGPNLTGDQVVDGRGAVLLPGLVDLHTHLREPGREDAETVASGSAAAALGGYTAVFAMPNTQPATDTAGVAEQVWRLGRDSALVDVQPIGAVTVGRAGAQLAELGAMADSAARVRVFSDDGTCVADPVVMRRALEYVRAFDGVVAQHAEDPRLTAGAQMHEGEVSARLGLAGWPAVAEEAIIARDALLAGHVRSRVHICHVSTVGAVQIVRLAKAHGLPVTAEVTPHHLMLTDDLGRDLRPGVQGQPAVAYRRGRRGAARWAGRRHDRLCRHRSRPACARGQGDRVGCGAAGHARATDGTVRGDRDDGAPRPAGLARAGRADERCTGPDRLAAGAWRPTERRRAGQPGAGRRRRDVDRLAGRARVTLAQHPVRRSAVARAGGGHLPAGPGHGA